jgi:excisionase family DNA binding protein
MPTIHPDSPLLTRAEIASALSVTRDYLDHAARRGEGPPYIKFGRLIRYDRSAVSEWLAAQAGAKAA